MLSTTITSINFNKFSKSLSKKTKNKTFPIPLLTAQEIISKTLGNSNHHEFTNKVKNEKFDSFIIDENNFELVFNKFLNILKFYEFNYNSKDATLIFRETFGLEETRKLSLTDIIIELNNMKKNGSVLLEKVFFGKNHDKDGNIKVQLYMYPNTFDYSTFNKFKKEVNEKEAYSFISMLLSRYKNLNRVVTPNSSPIFLYKTIKDMSKDEKQQFKFISLINELYNYSDDEIINALKKNHMHFMVHNGYVFIISCEIRKNHYLIRQKITKKKFLIINEDILKKLFELESKESFIKLTYNNSLLSQKESFHNYDLALEKLKKSENNVLLIAYENDISDIDGGFYFLQEYLEYKEGEIQLRFIKK